MTVGTKGWIQSHALSQRSVGCGLRGSIPRCYPKWLTQDNLLKHALSSTFALLSFMPG